MNKHVISCQFEHIRVHKSRIVWCHCYLMVQGCSLILFDLCRPMMHDVAMSFVFAAANRKLDGG